MFQKICDNLFLLTYSKSFLFSVPIVEGVIDVQKHRFQCKWLCFRNIPQYFKYPLLLPHSTANKFKKHVYKHRFSVTKHCTHC